MHVSINKRAGSCLACQIRKKTRELGVGEGGVTINLYIERLIDMRCSRRNMRMLALVLFGHEKYGGVPLFGGFR